jgi:hypothetical protein
LYSPQANCGSHTQPGLANEHLPFSQYAIPNGR